MSLPQTTPLAQSIPSFPWRNTHIRCVFRLHKQSSIYQHPFHLKSFLSPFIHFLNTSLLRPPSAATCNKKYLKQYTFANGALFSPTSVRPTFHLLEYCIAVFLFNIPSVILNYSMFPLISNCNQHRRHNWLIFYWLVSCGLSGLWSCRRSCTRVVGWILTTQCRKPPLVVMAPATNSTATLNWPISCTQGNFTKD